MLRASLEGSSRGRELETGSLHRFRSQLRRELPGQHLRDETRNRVGDFHREVFRQKVGAFHRDLLLIGPCAAELTLRTDQKPRWIAIDEQFRNPARGEPVRICVHDLNHVPRVTFDGQLP
jgi:hypothetical protein